MNQFFQVHQILINNIAIALFVLSMIFLALLVIRFRKAKPAESGECLNCRYPLTGLDAQTQNCPECGKKLTAADWSPTVRWRRPGVLGLLMHPYAIWACFAISFVGSVFLSTKIDKTHFDISQHTTVFISNKAISMNWRYNLSGVELNVLGMTAFSRHEPQRLQQARVYLSHRSPKLFIINPQNMTFNFDARALPDEFKDAPGLTTEQNILPSNGPGVYYSQRSYLSVPVNHETIARMLQSWDIGSDPIDEDLVYRAVVIATDDANWHRPLSIAWNFKPPVWPRVVRTLDTTRMPHRWLYNRCVPTFFAGLLVSIVLVVVMHKTSRKGPSKLDARM